MTSGGYSAKTGIVFDELAHDFQLIDRGASVYEKIKNARGKIPKKIYACIFEIY
jgi:hypothetical protein